MKTSLLSLFAGTVFLAGAAGASAGQPVTLASADLDAITAGQDATATAIAVGAIAFNIADVDQSNKVKIHGSYNYVSQSNYSSIYQSASATNYGAVTAAAVASSTP